jgi:quercetin dioxygenase-like cupin family protein
MRSLPPPTLEQITDRPGRQLVVLMATPEAVVTESRYAAGQPGADPHVHRRHADIFHVVEGALVFVVGPARAEHRLSRGDTVIAPPGLVHGFRVPASEDSWYLNVHAPGVGFDVYLRERGIVDDRGQLDAMADRHDSYDVPADGGLPVEHAVIAAGGLVATWRAWAPPGQETETAAAAMEAALALTLERHSSPSSST